MQTRFEDAFSMNLEIKEDPAACFVPPMSIQILVENAVKHNRLSLERPLKVDIFTENGNLVVRNNVIGEKTPEHSSGGLGLKNIEHRYAYLTDKKIRIEKDKYFTVSLPLLTKEHEQVLSK